MHPHRIADAADALTFVEAGHARFTLVSEKTGQRYTYQVNKAKEGDAKFVSLLTGPSNTDDYNYLGLYDRTQGMRLTRKSRMTADSAPVKAFSWTVRHLVAGKFPQGLEFWHEGRCCRCGRTLTVPESIENGIGPECAKKMG